MSNKKEPKMEKAKKSEKPSIDSHREFLDMDTDEEDFSQQESPKIEEELPPEPEKPVFKEEHLNKLVQYVKDLTVLPFIKNSDWNDDCHTIIREYFENPSFSLLCVYFEENVLKMRLSNVPKRASDGFVYFLRTPWHIFTVDNFHATVIFGSINRDTKMCILKIIENMYMPLALNSDHQPEIIRNNLFFNLHNFMICLTERIYKPIELTKLYVPKENLPNVAVSFSNKFDLPKENVWHICNELTESEKAMIERLEGIVRCWIKEIREVLAKAFICKTRQTISDELQHWTTIYFDLYCLLNQLSHKEIQSILRLLENIRSSSVDSFQLLTMQLHERLEQASSNVTYLSILSEACNNLRCPDKIEESMTNILFLILFVWTESSFYNNANNIEILCEAVSTQVLYQCKDYIDLQVLLEGDAENGIKILEECIVCCQTYRTVYDKIMSIITHIKFNNSWNVSEQTVFDPIDTFIQRCYDVIEICDALIVFGKRNKVGIIGGARGTKHEAYCRRIEDLFDQNLDEIKLHRNDILDVAKSTWSKNMQKFRDCMTELENMIKNLIDCIFEEVKNVEEGIEAIYALQRFKYKESLCDILSTKWTQVWKIFGREIESCNNNIVLNETCHPLLQYCSEDVITSCTIQYLEGLFHMMINASDWIGDCTVEKYILEQYKRVTDAIANKIPSNKS